MPRKRVTQSPRVPNVGHERVLKVLSEMYPNDKTRPGMVSAWLEDQQVFYVSAVRYPRNHFEKEILAAAKAPTACEAMRKLGLKLLALVGRGPTTEMDQLEKELDA